MEAGKSKICRVGWQTEGPEKTTQQFEAEHSLLGELPLPPGRSVSFLLRLFPDRMRPVHVMKGNLLYSKSADFNVNLI